MQQRLAAAESARGRSELDVASRLVCLVVLALLVEALLELLIGLLLLHTPRLLLCLVERELPGRAHSELSTRTPSSLPLIRSDLLLRRSA